jgi:predicted nuclease of predicted toxin-antitoxin system
VERLPDVYPASQHVSGVGLGTADDSAVWEHARRNGFAIVSKDSDFAERSVLENGSPKVKRS